MALSKLTGDARETEIPTRSRGPFMAAFTTPGGNVYVSIFLPGPRTVAAGQGPTLPEALRDLAREIERKEAELPRPCPHEAAMNTWNTMDRESQQTMERLADGTETLGNLGAATFAELAEYGLVERDGEDGAQWTPLGYEMAGWLEEHGGCDAS